MKIKSTTGLTVIFALCFFAITAIGTWATRRQQPSATSQIENKLQLLRVISVNETPLGNGMQRVLSMSVQNTSDKNIVGYVLVKKDGSTITSSGATTGWVLAPGQTDVLTVSVNFNEEPPSLYAALLEDGTGEGNVQELTRLRDYRSGIEKQFQRAIPILRETKTAPVSAQGRVVFDDLRGRLAALPEKGSEAISPGMASGLHHAKEFIIRQLNPVADKLKDNNGLELRIVQSDVDQVLTHIEATLKKLQSGKPDAQPTSQVR